MLDTIRSILRQHGRLATDAALLAPDDDLYQHGLSSHASVNLMLALEDAFEVEFPEAMLRRKTFESIAQIHASIDALVRSRQAVA
ncbi:MAG: acyl carrier protein [Gemmatimonadaceae bacterium]|jgi:acyl carrier protein|nr:acyl carrier protein [Gemmatimonadaceae bacterium]